MKRMMTYKSALVIGLLLCASLAFGANVLMGPQRPQATNTLLSAATTPADGTAIDLGYAADKFTCTMTWGGTVPTNVVWALKGSIDGVNFATLATQTSTASPDTFHVVFKPVRWIQGSYVSKSGGDATTAVSISCLAGGL